MNFDISKISIGKNKIKDNNGINNRYPNLAPLKADTVSFGAMKKSQFDGIDLMIINKFKAPIEKFNTNDDLQEWCEKRINELKKKDLTGFQNHKETTEKREETFKEWCEHVETLKKDKTIKSSTALFILDGILSDIGNRNNALIARLDKELLAQTISNIEDKLKKNPKVDFSFNKEYKTALKNGALKRTSESLDSNKTGWIKIPSHNNDPEHYEENRNSLQELSAKTWCTSKTHADNYLWENDFHIYYDNGSPKLAVLVDKNGEVAKMYSYLNKSEIPIKYLDEVKKRFESHKLSDEAKKEIEFAEKVRAYISKLEEEKGISFKTCSAKQLFDALDIKYEVDDDGLLILEKYYYKPYREFSYSDIGVDENRLFKQIKEIKGDASFVDSQVTDLGALERIGGEADFRESKVKNLGKLKSIEGKLHIKDTRLKYSDFKNVELNINIRKAENKLKEQGVDFKTCSAKQLFDALDIEYKVGDDGLLILEKYEQPDEEFSFKDIGVDENRLFKEIGEIKGNLYIPHTNITDLGNLKVVGGRIEFGSTQIKKLKNLERIGGDAGFRHSKVLNLGNLERIEGDANFCGTDLTDLGKLEYIGGSAYFTDSSIKNLGELKRIEKGAYFAGSDIENLGKLEYIGGEAYFANSKVKNLGNLKYIGGNINIDRSPLKYSDFKDIELTINVRKAENKLKEQGVDFKTCSIRQLFDVFGIEYEVDDDGLLIVKKYRKPDRLFTFEDLGVDEERLSKEIKEIRE